MLDEEVLKHVRRCKKEMQDETDQVIQKAANTYDQRAKFIEIGRASCRERVC